MTPQEKELEAIRGEIEKEIRAIFNLLGYNSPTLGS